MSLLRELVPDDKLDAAFESLSIAASSGAAALAERKPEQEDAEVVAAANGDADAACEPDFEGEEESSDEESAGEDGARRARAQVGQDPRRVPRLGRGAGRPREEDGRHGRAAAALPRAGEGADAKVLGQLTFETRKYVGNVFRAMTVHNLRGFIELVGERPDIMRWLVEGYRNNDTALICGSMLRDCFEYQTLTMIFLQDLEPEFEFLFKVTMENSNFDISADALINISRLLTVHKKATVQILDSSFDRIFGLLNGLLTSENYATRRQALQLLLGAAARPRELYCHAAPSDALRMDAFHVFKIFVANPNKSPEVEQLLVRNCEKLLAFVSDFGKAEVSRDFLQERSLLVFALERMAEKERAQEKTQEQATRPASLSNAERMPISGPVSEVCVKQK
ncbi:uncharacterized protein IUM83_15073 [Phytophthora cinnamomi]|uniref:uncharacterized protein n=1 Tax=Phytophthora cinnamomi TaxID=4785 RepID=UPI003559AB6C|nr:hypothetical protein IUM83_15073 [Phytophthora cinnamomi]